MFFALAFGSRYQNKTRIEGTERGVAATCLETLPDITEIVVEKVKLLAQIHPPGQAVTEENCIPHTPLALQDRLDGALRGTEAESW